MAASVISTRRPTREHWPRTGASQRLVAKFAIVVAVAVAALGGAFFLKGIASKSANRPVTIEPPPAHRVAPVQPSFREIERAAHKLAVAFAVSREMGEALTKQEELIPRYLSAVPSGEVSRGWTLDSYTLRSAAVPDEVCRRVGRDRGAYPSEISAEGLQCYKDRLTGANHLGFRLEPIRESDKTWRKAVVRVQEVQGAAYASLSVLPGIETNCEPSPPTQAGQGVLTGQHVVFAEHVTCIPAWRWEEFDPQTLGVVVLNETERLTWSTAAGGSLTTISVEFRNSRDTELAWQILSSQVAH